MRALALLLGTGGALLGALEPEYRLLAVFGAGAAVLASLPQPGRRSLPSQCGLVAALALAVASFCRPSLRQADTVLLYSYLRSAAFDGDLHFANERQQLGVSDPWPDTATGHRPNPHGPGPALLWAPFFFAAHAYVKAAGWLGASGVAADGFSSPYLRSMLAGTSAAAAVGCLLLGRAIRARAGSAPAVLAVVAAFAASPALYYCFVVPGMSHGPAFALTSVGVWLTDRVREEDRRRNWVALGALAGLLLATRYQDVAFLLFPAPFALAALRSPRGRGHVLAAAVASLLAFAPQLLSWKIIDGAWVRLPGGAGVRYAAGESGMAYMDPRAPRLLDVLLSADHGLLVWTPIALPALAGLAFGPRSWGWLARGGLLVVLVNLWLSATLTHSWTGEDAFGARRFDVSWPFFAVGLAAVAVWLRRRPLVLPALVALAAAAWNVGLMALYQRRATRDAAPLERAAEYQAHQLRRVLENAAERLGGPGARALVYRALVGEYFYWNINPSGTISVAARGDERYLDGGWSPPMNRSGPATFRWAQGDESCVRIPIANRPQHGLRTVVTLRAPEELEGSQIVTPVLNGRPLPSAVVTHEWSDTAFVLPASVLHSGENRLCLTFHTALPDGRTAAVSVIQLP